MALDQGKPVPPPADLNSRTIEILPDGGYELDWSRIGQKKYSPIHYSQDSGWRFSSSRIPGILYLGDDAVTCFWEVFWDDLITRPLADRRLDHAKVDARACAQVVVPRGLRIIDTRDAEVLRTISAPHGTFQGPYTNCQAWAEAFWNHPVKVHGFLFDSARNAGGVCLALFEDRMATLNIVATAAVPLLESQSIATEITRYGLVSLANGTSGVIPPPSGTAP